MPGILVMSLLFPSFHTTSLFWLTVIKWLSVGKSPYVVFNYSMPSAAFFLRTPCSIVRANRTTVLTVEEQSFMGKVPQGGPVQMGWQQFGVTNQAALGGSSPWKSV